MKETTVETVYFSEPGPANTERALALASNRARALAIHTVLVASTSGRTAVKALSHFQPANLVAVSHCTGFTGPNRQEMQPAFRKELEASGVKILTAQHSFGGVNRAVRKMLGTYQLDEIIAATLRIFGQGVKVCIEMSLMAADAGLVRTDEPAVCLAGSSSGADTALVLFPANAHAFFDLRVAEFICLPAPIQSPGGAAK